MKIFLIGSVPNLPSPSVCSETTKNNNTSISKTNACGISPSTSNTIEHCVSPRPKRLRKTLKDVFEENSSDPDDFSSDDSVQDPNYIDPETEERALVANENYESDSEPEENNLLEDIETNNFNFSKKSTIPKIFSEFTFNELPGLSINITESSPSEIFEKTLGLNTLQVIVEQSIYMQISLGKI